MPVSVYDMFEEIFGLLKRGRRKVVAVPPISPEYVSLLPLFSLDTIFTDKEILEKVKSLFGLIYQCLVPFSWKADFNLQQYVLKKLPSSRNLTNFWFREAISLIQILVDQQQTNRSIWDGLLQNLTQQLESSQQSGVATAEHSRLLASLVWHFVTQELAETNLCHALDNGELLFFDEQVVQYLCARFLTDEDLAQPILDTWATHYKGKVLMFSWRSSYYLCSTHWNFVYDLVGTKRFVSSHQDT